MLFFQADSGLFRRDLLNGEKDAEKDAENLDGEKFQPALAYLRRCLSSATEDALRINGMEPGAAVRIALGNGSFAMEQSYFSRARSDCFFEAHRLYIDVQCVISGEEMIDVLPAAGLEVGKPYRPEKDVVIFKDPGPGQRLRMGPGCIAVFYPEDGHMPGQWVEGPVPVRKTVIKVPITSVPGLQ